MKQNYRRLFSLPLKVAFILGSSATMAAEEAVVVSGPLDYYYFYNSDIGAYSTVRNGSFEATVTHDSSTPLSSASNNYAIWSGAVLNIEYSVYNASGDLLNTYSVDGDNSYSSTYQSVNNFDYPIRHGVGWEISSYANGVEVEAYIELRNYANQSLQPGDLGNYPNPIITADLDFGNFIVDRWDYNISNGYTSVGASITSSAPVIADTDGDGVGDNADQCDASDLSATVVVGSNDSGVSNALLSDGCTISDGISIAFGDVNNQGKKNKAVAHFLNGLKKDGIISGKQKGALQSAASKSK